jgi:hypothetical protein
LIKKTKNDAWFFRERGNINLPPLSCCYPYPFCPFLHL